MADVTIRSPDCEEEGDRGHRGRRGRPGPTGPTGSGGGGGGSTGPTGPTGPGGGGGGSTGPTGPGSTGSTGPTGPGGGGSGTAQSFRYTVTGAEPDTSDFLVTLPVARATDVYRVTYGLAGVAVIVGLDFPDLVAGDRTTTQFRVIATALMQAGDQIDFYVTDPAP